MHHGGFITMKFFNKMTFLKVIHMKEVHFYSRSGMLCIFFLLSL